MKFTEKFNINQPQSRLEFIDIRLDRDNKFFIDPSRIELQKDDFYQECALSIQSYISTILSLYAAGPEGKAQARRLFRYSGETNETHFGLCRGRSVGRGNSEEILTNVFDEIEKNHLIDDELIQNPMDISLFIENFAEDRLSDLVTSIIKKLLSDFTVKQCEKLGIPLSETEVDRGNYWNRHEGRWERFSAKVVVCEEDKPILLVPKKIAVLKFLYHPEQYLSSTVFAWRKEYHKENDTSLLKRTVDRDGNELIKPPTNRELREVEIARKGLTTKQYLMLMSRENPKLIISWRKDIDNLLLGSKSNGLTDDKILEETDSER